MKTKESSNRTRILATLGRAQLPLSFKTLHERIDKDRPDSTPEDIVRTVLASFVRNGEVVEAEGRYLLAKTKRIGTKKSKEKPMEDVVTKAWSDEKQPAQDAAEKTTIGDDVTRWDNVLDVVGETEMKIEETTKDDEIIWNEATEAFAEKTQDQNRAEIINQSLDTLEKNLNVPPAQTYIILDYRLKISVLDRLAGIVSDDIGRVLQEIAEDVQNINAEQPQ